jgi:hypothetical protein
MKNQNLFNVLKEEGFEQVTNSILSKEFREDYRILIEFSEEDENIVVFNYYYNSENKFDWPKRNVIFCGTCKTIKELATLSQILNIENCAKKFFGKIECFFEGKCDCGCK